jgi:hypothetical protein
MITRSHEEALCELVCGGEHRLTLSCPSDAMPLRSRSSRLLKRAPRGVALPLYSNPTK